jgi:hypothetical protein
VAQISTEVGKGPEEQEPFDRYRRKDHSCVAKPQETDESRDGIEGDVGLHGRRHATRLSRQERAHDEKCASREQESRAPAEGVAEDSAQEGPEDLAEQCA